jgi:hypothetical protein
VIVHYLAMLATIRVGLKVVDNDNTLAYYGTELITAIKSFMVVTLSAEIGAKALSITKFSIMTFSIMTLSITTFSIMTLSITTFSIMPLSIKSLIGTFSIKHSVIMPSATFFIVMLNVIRLNVVMLNVVMLSVDMLSVVMLNVVILKVVAPRNLINKLLFLFSIERKDETPT